MAIEKRISLTLETGDAKKRIKELQDAIAGVDKKLPKKGSDPVAPITDSYKKGRKTILDYAGTLSNSDRIVKQSAGTMSLVEKVALKYDTTVRKLNKAKAEGVINTKELNSALSQAAVVNAQATKEAAKLDKRLGNTSGFKVMRGSLSGISYQLQDIAVQLQMGTNLATVFGQQGPQIASYFGPLGAVAGVFIAIGAAIGGTALTAFLDLEDAGDKLEKQMDSLNKVMEKTSDGAFLFSDSIVELKKSSESFSNIKVGLAIYDAQKAIETANKGIGNSVSDLGDSFRNLFGLIDGDYMADIEALQSAGVDLSKILSGALRASDVNGPYAISDSINDLRRLVVQISDDFEISEREAANFIESISKLNDADSLNGFRSVQNSLSDIVSTILDGGMSKAQGEFVGIASSIAEMAEKGATATQILQKLTKEVSSPSFAFANAFTQSQESIAAMNEDFNTTSSLITSINDEYRRLNELQIKSADISSGEALNQARLNSIQIIADEIASLDTYAERQKVVNDLVSRSTVLRKDDGQAALDAANEQNFVYEKQIDTFGTLVKIWNQGKDSAINFASETEAWSNELAELGRQIGDIYDQGAKDYADSVGSYNESLQGMVTSAFSTMEDSLVQFALTGKGSFKDFANSILEDLLRIQTQQALAGLAGSFSFGGGTTTTTTTAASKGATVSRYAQGGITGMANTIQSTPKYFANGGGLLGESAQAEAILPLTRTSGGDLGVKTSGGGMQNVNINITNETGASMELEETSRSVNSSGGLDINVIAKGVNQVISSGRADKVMKTRFKLTERAR